MISLDKDLISAKIKIKNSELKKRKIQYEYGIKTVNLKRKK